MKYAIVKSGSSQYRAEEGAVIEVDQLAAQVGDTVELTAVLVADGGTVRVGTPTVAGTVVTTTVLSHERGPKIRVFKYKPKQRYRHTSGQRSCYTRLQVNQIVG